MKCSQWQKQKTEDRRNPAAFAKSQSHPVTHRSLTLLSFCTLNGFVLFSGFVLPLQLAHTSQMAGECSTQPFPSVVFLLISVMVFSCDFFCIHEHSVCHECATRPIGYQSHTDMYPSSEKTYTYKLVLLGDSAVGKSSLVLRFVKGQFSEYQESTIGGEANAILVSHAHPLVSLSYSSDERLPCSDHGTVLTISS